MRRVRDGLNRPPFHPPTEQQSAETEQRLVMEIGSASKTKEQRESYTIVKQSCCIMRLKAFMESQGDKITLAFHKRLQTI
jgi:hypothetical protein